MHMVSSELTILKFYDLMLTGSDLNHGRLIIFTNDSQFIAMEFTSNTLYRLIL
jgi:hypothetical protein